MLSSNNPHHINLVREAFHKSKLMMRERLRSTIEQLFHRFSIKLKEGLGLPSFYPLATLPACDARLPSKLTLAACGHGENKAATEGAVE